MVGQFADRVAVEVVVMLGGGAAAILAVLFGISSADDFVRHARAVAAAPARDDRVTVVITDLDGPGGQASTTLLYEIIGQMPAIGAYRYPRTLKISDVGDFATNLAAAEQTGQKWLRSTRADVLVLLR